jgi:hypothetical protein
MTFKFKCHKRASLEKINRTETARLFEGGGLF